MLRDVFENTIDKNLSINTKQFERGVARYVDKNSHIFLSLDLSVGNSFADKDREVLFQAIGVTSNQAKEEIHKSKDIKDVNKIMSNPFYCMSILACRSYLKKKDEMHALLVLVYASMNLYATLHFGAWKYGSNKNIMDYTIANLDNSFIIRQVSSIYAWLEDNAKTTLETYRDRILKADDKDIGWIVLALKDRIKGKLKKISKAYYSNHENGNYLNYDTDSIEQGNYHVMDNDSYAVDRLATKVYLKLINKQFDSKFIKYSITRSDTSYNKLANIIEDVIMDDNDNSVRTVVSSMIEYYVLTCKKPPESIGRGEFISYMKQSYASNSPIPQLGLIKSSIDKWLDINMYKYGKAKYANTAKAQYRKSIFMFLVFVINHEAKLQ